MYPYLLKVVISQLSFKRVFDYGSNLVQVQVFQIGESKDGFANLEKGAAANVGKKFGNHRLDTF